MIFSSIREFLSDVETVVSNNDNDSNIQELGNDPNIVDLGPTKIEKRQATIRIFAQLLLTVFVIGLCLYVVINTSPSDTGNKLAYTGFGIVFGYWFK